MPTIYHPQPWVAMRLQVCPWYPFENSRFIGIEKNLAVSFARFPGA